MRLVYSVVKYVPDPFNGESVNVGVVVGSDESSQWVLQRVRSLTRARGLRTESVTLSHVAEYLEALEGRLERHSSAFAENGHSLGLPPDPDAVNEAWLSDLASRQQSVIQFTPPMAIEADSISRAMQLLWPVMIVERIPQHLSYSRKSKAVSAMHEALIEAKISAHHVWPRALLNTEGFEIAVDYVVANGSVAHLTQCFSFQIPDKDSLMHDIEAWAYKVKRLRSDGGLIDLGSNGNFPVEPRVPLDVVYVPPQSEEDEPAFNLANTAFDDLGVGLRKPMHSAGEVAQAAKTALERFTMHSALTTDNPATR